MDVGDHVGPSCHFTNKKNQVFSLPLNVLKTIAEALSNSRHCAQCKSHRGKAYTMLQEFQFSMGSNKLRIMVKIENQGMFKCY